MGHVDDHRNTAFIWRNELTSPCRLKVDQVIDHPAGKLPEDSRNPKDIVGDTKPPLHLVPPAALIHFAMAMQDGAKKYGPYNWRQKKVELMCYLGACLRHVAACIDREDLDPKSKVHHLAHAGACCAIALDALETGNLIDDRPPAGAGGELIRRHTQSKK